MPFKKLLHAYFERRAADVHRVEEPKYFNPTPNAMDWDKLKPAQRKAINRAVSSAIALSNVPLPEIPTAKYEPGQVFKYGQDTVTISLVSTLTKWDVFPGEPLPEHQYRVYINKDVNWLYESELDNVLDLLACKALGVKA